MTMSQLANYCISWWEIFKFLINRVIKYFKEKQISNELLLFVFFRLCHVIYEVVRCMPRAEKDEQAAAKPSLFFGHDVRFFPISEKLRCFCPGVRAQLAVAIRALLGYSPRFPLAKRAKTRVGSTSLAPFFFFPTE